MSGGRKLVGGSCFISVFTSTVGTIPDGQDTRKLLSYQFSGSLYLRRCCQDPDYSDEGLDAGGLLGSVEAC